MKVIFEDESLLVMDKPPGLVIDKSRTHMDNTLEDWLVNRLGSQGHALERGGIVHRLDKNTSGVLLVAKTQEALENLQRQFKSREVKKEYIVLVHGLVRKGGRVEGNIGRNPGNREKFTVLVDGEGKDAVTQYEPIKNLQFTMYNLQKIFSDFNKIQLRKLYILHYTLYTLLACRPETGRTHQIRVHLKYINHPIVSDEVYVGRRMYRLDKRWCPRMFLHAKKIGFYHPGSGKWMELESELPSDLKNSLSLLRESVT